MLGDQVRCLSTNQRFTREILLIAANVPFATYLTFLDLSIFFTWIYCSQTSYRFANEPVSNNDSDDDKNKNENNLQRKSYGGKLQIKFRDDGYTEVISPNGEDEVINSNTAIFQKVWGWDLETSTEDSLDYLLFSADVRLPPS